jgi:hypothetical protein
MSDLEFNAVLEQVVDFSDESFDDLDEVVAIDAEISAESDMLEAQPDESAELAPSPAILVGNWVNNNSGSRGIVRVQLRPLSGGAQNGMNLAVRAFGSCTPTPCDWGWVRGASFSRSVSAVRGIAFSARYVESFKETWLVGYLSGATLVVESFNRFTDGSNRFNYFSRDFFHKA